MDDLVEFDVIPVITSVDAAARGARATALVHNVVGQPVGALRSMIVSAATATAGEM